MAFALSTFVLRRSRQGRVRKIFWIGLILFFLGSLPTVGEETPGEDLLPLNFKDADIKLVIEAIGELTGTNFVYDGELVTGTVTVCCATRIAKADVLRVLDSILEIKGLATVETADGLVKIVPRSEARTKEVGTRVGKELSAITREDRIYTQVVRLDFADAVEVQRILGPLVARDAVVSSSAETNTLIITDTSSNIYRLVKIINELDQEDPAGKQRIYVHYLNNADPQETAKVLTSVWTEKMKAARMVRGAKKPAGTSEGIPPVIVADKATNSLVVSASPREYKVLGDIIAKLDIVRKQVLVEALIAEVSLDKMMELGVEWATWDQSAEDSDRVIGATDFGVRSDLVAQTLTGLNLGIVRGANIGAILHAHGEDKDFNIRSAPIIFARDNEESEIKIVDNIPYVKKSRITETDVESPTVIKDYAYREVGITLKITPHISRKGLVRLDLHEKIEKLLEGADRDYPATAIREIKNTVDVQDGSTIVVGGLMRNDKATVTAKVPILGDLPLLGWLFRRKREVSLKTSLLIFISPHVLGSREEAEAIREEKKRQGREIIGSGKRGRTESSGK